MLLATITNIQKTFYTHSRQHQTFFYHIRNLLQIRKYEAKYNFDCLSDGNLICSWIKWSRKIAAQTRSRKTQIRRRKTVTCDSEDESMYYLHYKTEIIVE